jgi:hypothetical protein
MNRREESKFILQMKLRCKYTQHAAVLNAPSGGTAGQGRLDE